MTFSKMLLLLIMVALFEHNSTVYAHNGLIYNGELFKSEDYPFVIHLRIKLTETSYEICTGSLIKKLLVLTAAHCCYNFPIADMQICQGSRYKDQNYDHETDWHNVSKMYVHEKYNSGTRGQDVEHDDLCMLKLEKAFPNVTKFSKIGGSHKDFENGKKLSCLVIGFGAIADAWNTSSDNGLFGRITTVDVTYGKNACVPNRQSSKDAWKQHLCVAASDSRSCQGDSGGPMICNNLQYGVGAFKYTTDGAKSVICSSRNVQSVYMFLNYHKKWINNIIKLNEKDKKKRKRSFGNLLKPHYYLLYIILTILLCNMFTFI